MFKRWWQLEMFRLGVLFLLIWMVLAGLYFFSGSNYLFHYADNIDLLLAAYFQGLAHPPGYPLLVLLLSKLTFLFNAPPLVVGRWFASLLQGLVGASFFLLLTKLRPTTTPLKGWEWLSLVAALFWGTSYFVWRQGTVVEVFSLAWLFSIWFAIAWVIWVNSLEKRWVWLALSGLLAGLALFHHQVTLFFILPFLVWGVIMSGFFRKGVVKRSFIGLFSGLSGFLLGVFSFAFLSADKPFSWPTTGSFEGTRSFFFRELYIGGGSIRLPQSVNYDLFMWVRSLGFIFSRWSFEWGLIAIVLLLVGLFGLFRKKRDLFWLMVVGGLPAFLGLSWLLKFPVYSGVSDMELYWGSLIRWRMLYAHQLLFGIVLVFGLHLVVVWWRKQWKFSWFIGLTVIMVSAFTAYRYPQISLSGRNEVETFAFNLLKELPVESVLLVDGDMIFPLLYHQLVGGFREDVAIVPSSAVAVRSYWLDQRQGELYGTDEFTDIDRYMAHTISWSLEEGRRVYLYNPNETLLSYLGVEADPFYAIPAGYLLEVSEEYYVPAWNYDLSVSEQLSGRAAPEWDWNTRGFLGNLSAAHAKLAYYYYLLGLEDVSQVHADFSTNLSSTQAQQELAIKVVETAQERVDEGSYTSQLKAFTAEEYQEKAEAAFDEDELDQAEYFITRAILLKPKDISFREFLVEVYDRMEEFEEADEERARIRELQLF